jgi:hypothetical protein
MDDLKSILRATYEPQQKAQELLGPKGYTLDPEHSTMTSKVFIKDGQPIIAHRGSTRLSDFLYEDPVAALGFKTERVKQAKQLSRDVENKYSVKPTNVGSSLGGYIAQRATTGGKVITYNKLANLHDMMKKSNPNQQDIRTRYDIPSVLSSYQKNVKTIKGSINPLKAHRISQL